MCVGPILHQSQLTVALKKKSRKMNVEKDYFHLLLIIITITMISGFVSGENCKGDSYGPCSCSYDPTTMTGPAVNCYRIPVSTVESIFKKVKNLHLSKFTLTPNINDTRIIPNVIGTHTVGILELTCPRRRSRLIIDSAAFSQTKSVTTDLYIAHCDLVDLNWSFLADFTKLSYLDVEYCSNFHVTFFNTFPSASLTSLSIFSLSSIMGLNGFKNSYSKTPAKLPNGLSQVYINYSYDLGDDALKNFLAKWVIPSSKNTLSYLEVSGNSLTKIPSDVLKFNQLNTANFYENVIPLTILKGAFNFNATVQTVYLDDSHIKSVPDGAFKGDFTTSYVSLSLNELTTLNEKAFKPMLLQMSKDTGYLEVGANPFDCSLKNQCGLAWLIRDNPSLLDNMWSAQCSNGTYFHDLNPKDLRKPNGQKCP